MGSKSSAVISDGIQPFAKSLPSAALAFTRRGLESSDIWGFDADRNMENTGAASGANDKRKPLPLDSFTSDVANQSWSDEVDAVDAAAAAAAAAAVLNGPPLDLMNLGMDSSSPNVSTTADTTRRQTFTVSKPLTRSDTASAEVSANASLLSPQVRNRVGFRKGMLTRDYKKLWSTKPTYHDRRKPFLTGEAQATFDALRKSANAHKLVCLEVLISVQKCDTNRAMIDCVKRVYESFIPIPKALNEFVAHVEIESPVVPSYYMHLADLFTNANLFSNDILVTIPVSERLNLRWNQFNGKAKYFLTHYTEKRDADASPANKSTFSQYNATI
jgi:hypothetical protein